MQLNEFKQEGSLLISLAIGFAADCHKYQKRKGTDRPYIYHPLKTMEYLVQMEADVDLVIAGVLHDVIEDTACNYSCLAVVFGTKAADLINAHTEDKRLPWRERKQVTIEHCKSGSRELRMLIMADTMANLNDTCADVKKYGEDVWKRFNTTKEKQKWYYGEKVRALKSLQAEFPEQYLLMESMYDEAFGQDTPL